jgi:superoxide reductase
LLKQKIEESIKEYNRYRSPEITAKLISINDQSFKIEFTGSFCYTCGFFDYFDDYKILLEEKGLATSINEIVEIDEGAHVNFKIT